MSTRTRPVKKTEAAPASDPPDPRGTPGTPGTRNTVVLLALTAVTNLADGIIKIALPVLATGITDSPGQVAAVALALTLPWLLVSLPAGVLADRADRRRLLWLAGGIRLLAIGWLIQTVTSDSTTIGTLAAVGAVLGTAEVIAQTSETALIPALVPRAERERANAWIAGVETAANEFCGPMIGGLLLTAGTGIALGSTWVAYLAAALLLLLLTGRFRAVRTTKDEAPTEPGTGTGTETGTGTGTETGTGTGTGTAPRTGRAPRAREFTEGLRYLWHHRLLRTTTLILTVLGASWGAWLALMPLVAKETMGLDARQYGIVLSALGVGGLAGTLAVTRINRLLGRRWAMFADLLGTLAMMAVPVLTTQVWAVATAAFIGGMGGTLWTVNSRLIAQNTVPDALMGRYSSAARLIGWGGMPIGAGLIGVLAEAFGTRVAFLVFAAAVAATIPPFLRIVTTDELRKSA
ncbi:MFS transporter [Streptomyces uncialis]|uniref:MFS transporter n=1 Tax=Streptomyces uncialis TaxID=1048205 RepID=UPI003866DD5A|nr:MFS transporter [Streptomyces uncialis]